MGKLHCHPKSSIYAGGAYATRSTNPAGSTTAITLPELNGFGDDYFNNHYYMQVLKNSNSAGNAPEHQVRKITDYVSATGVFTTDAFTANVESGDEVLILHESLVALGRDDSNNVFDSSSVTANEDGSVLERLQWVQDTLGGAAIQLRVERSSSGTVEENQYMEFSIGLMDVDSGAIISANINITSISVEMAQSRAGGAFSAVGITQPTFTKGDGRVYCSYQFLAAEWQIGDVYRLKVSGITCTVGGDTAYVPLEVWSNLVMEGEDIDTNVETILAGQQGAGIASFPAAANPGNNINLAQVLRAVITSMVGGDDYDGYTNISNSTNTSINAIAQKFAVLFAADGTNTFNPTIGGSARTDMELALNALAAYFSASAAAWALQTNNQTARTNLEQTIGDINAAIGIDGANAWSTSIAGATQTTVEGSVQIIGSSVDHLYALADGGTNAYPDSVVQESIFAYIMSKSADPVVTSYNNTTDSLEAISDAISSGSYSVVADSGTSTTVVDATYTQADNYFNGCLLVCVSGTNAGQARPVVDFANATGTFTVYPAFGGAVVATDAFVLISGYKFAEWITMPDVAVNITSTDDAETNVFDLSTAGNSYRVNSLRIKSADPTGTDVVKVRLYELINDVSTEVDSFEITTSNYGTYFSLFDMFGTTHLSGDNLKITVQTTTGTTHVAVTGQYSYEKAYSA